MHFSRPHRLVPCAGYPALRCGGRTQAWLRRIAVLCMIVLLSACSKVVPLQTGLSDSDANEIVLVLNRQGIGVQKVRAKEGVDLLVDETDVSRATAAMNAAGLPRRSISSLGEVFKKEGMISTPLEERVRYLHGLSEELGYTLMQFDNVISARVHVVLPERIAPGEPIQPSSAAVFIKYRPPMDEDAVTPRVKRLVAGSIPGLSSEDGRSNVSVVMTPGEPPPTGVVWTTVLGFKVEADGAGSLRMLLFLFGFLALAGLGGAGFLAHKAGMLKGLIKKKAAGDDKAGQQTAAAT